MQSGYADRTVSEDTMGGNQNVKYYGLIMRYVMNRCRSSDVPETMSDVKPSAATGA